MERYLMDCCPHYDMDVCNETARRARKMSGPDEPGDPSTRFPRSKEQAKLYKICESCPHGLFEGENPKDPICPVCHIDLWDTKKAPSKRELKMLRRVRF